MQNHVNTIGSTQLRSQVGRMLNDALAGQTTVIERHGRPVARVVPYSEFSRIAARLARLEGLAEQLLGPEWESRLSWQDDSRPT